MTDRYNALVVVLGKNIRDDDAKPIIDAIHMIRGVTSVHGNVADMDAYIAEQRARAALEAKLLKVLREEGT